MRALNTLPLQGNETHIAPGSMSVHYAAIPGTTDHHATVHITGHVIVERIGCCVRRIPQLAEHITRTAYPTGLVVRA